MSSDSINTETKSGYRKTKLGLIPEDWQLKKLGKLFSFRNGVNASKEDYGQGIKFVNVMDVLENTFITEEKIIGSVQLTEKQVEKNLVKKGDVLFNRTSETQDEIGLTALYNDDAEAVFGGFVIRGRPKNNAILPEFNGYSFHSELVRKQIISKGQGAVRVNIGQSDLEQVRLPFPPLPEQKKIAEILTTWDKAIETLEQLIAKKEELKKGLMQQLLTGKKRFPGFEEEWEERKLGECVIGKGDYGINAPSTSFSEDLPVYLRITDIDDRGKFSRENKTSVDDENYSGYLLEEGDIVFARTGNTTGKTYLYDKRDGELVYAGFLIRFKPDPNILLPKFLKYYTDTHRYWYWVSVMSARSGQPGINSTEYSKLTFKVPPVEEQKKIIETIDHVYSDITQLGHLKEKFQYQKKGLMQQLLTGKTRVEVKQES